MDKLDCLKKKLLQLGEARIAFSGGMDSTLLCKIAYDTLKDKAKAITIKSEFVTLAEADEAKRLAKQIGIRHEIIVMNILGNKVVASNPENRCYYCKSMIMKRIGGPNLIDATNASDSLDRPGLKALSELKVISPLKLCGITKDDVKVYSQQLGLPVKPSQSCLATRIPYGKEITLDSLKKIDIIESSMRRLGFTDVRARLGEESVSLEILKAEDKIFDENKAKIMIMCRTQGYKTVSKGYRDGN